MGGDDKTSRALALTAAVRNVGRLLDSAEVDEATRLRRVLSTLATYAQRRELMLDCLRREVTVSDELCADAEGWLRRLAPALRWRSPKSRRRARRG
jgi:hypothetical protein